MALYARGETAEDSTLFSPFSLSRLLEIGHRNMLRRVLKSEIAGCRGTVCRQQMRGTAYTKNLRQFHVVKSCFFVVPPYMRHDVRQLGAR